VPEVVEELQGMHMTLLSNRTMTKTNKEKRIFRCSETGEISRITEHGRKRDSGGKDHVCVCNCHWE
jgi:hypothetical protein